jgi:hypothetical protein
VSFYREKGLEPPIPSKGKRATVRTTIPIPPSQCVIDLQNSIPCDRASISVKIEAPVVVNPDIVSKNASVYEGIAPENTKGRAPAREAVIQPKDTRRNPSLVPKTLFLDVFVTKKIRRDNGIIIVSVFKKAKTVSISEYKNETIADNIINIEIISIKTERTCRTVFIFTLQEVLPFFLWTLFR